MIGEKSFPALIPNDNLSESLIQRKYIEAQSTYYSIVRPFPLRISIKRKLPEIRSLSTGSDLILGLLHVNCSVAKN
jgi:hypothetical protein